MLSPATLRAEERRLHLAAFTGLAAGLIVAAFAVASGSLILSVASVFLTGFSSLVPDIIAYRRSARTEPESGRLLSPDIGPEIWQSLGIEHRAAEEVPPDWHLDRLESVYHTLH